jgi:hypothetical protein
MNAALNRRTVVFGLPLVGAAPLGFVAGQSVSVISGALTDDNYAPFEAFLLDALDEIVGLKLEVVINDQETDGAVSAYEREGQFTIYRPGAEQVAELVFGDGYAVNGDSCSIDGFFSVTPAGMHGAIATLLLASDELPKGARVDDYDIDNLPAGIQN